MYNPSIISSYYYRTRECRMTPRDAASDTAEFYGVDPAAFADFLALVGIHAEWLSFAA
jgi:hypothetical protein